MAAEGGTAERTEQPTERRLREARERGQVPRSRELDATLVLLAATLALLAFSPFLVRHAAGLMRAGLAPDPRALLDAGALGSALRHGALTGVVAVLAIGVPAALAALAAPLGVGGAVFSAEALRPDLGRLDPAAGLRRLFGLRGLAEAAKALVKLAVVGGAAALLLSHLLPRIAALGAADVAQGVAEGAWMVVLCLLALSAALGLVALVDVPYQIWNHRRGLRMTREEVREEIKETEGRPEVRGRIRQLQQERARRRMMQEVPKADVVVVNPTHFAVALRYESGRVRAPRVVARGRELVAARIREIAELHRVPVFESPPLARALYFATEVGEEIPAGLYTAVAKVLAWVYRTRTALRDGVAPPPAPSIADDELAGMRTR
ncbi:MAG: flagellar biosynthesis protein FlhB [Steroidobacteraceae bacterium]